jgi:hypothetical protein
MSISALLKGVEKRLRSEAVFNDQPSEQIGRYIGIQPAPGRPPRNFGQWYAAIHWGGGRGIDQNPTRHDVYHGVIVTLTARLNYAPKDRQGIRLVTVGDVYDLADRIAGPNIIHGNRTLNQFANEFIVGTQDYVNAAGEGVATVNGVRESLVLGSFGPERPASADWVSEGVAKDVYVIDFKFDLSRRTQENV